MTSGSFQTGIFQKYVAIKYDVIGISVYRSPRMNDKITQCQDTLYLETNFKEAIRATEQKMADKVIRTLAMTFASC